MACKVQQQMEVSDFSVLSGSIQVSVNLVVFRFKPRTYCTSSSSSWRSITSTSVAAWRGGGVETRRRSGLEIIGGAAAWCSGAARW
ncbi:unnamed protein product [Miscanthus lutarioriparius]|uniref:Uncharacterized protein n=1 Tax=Miscanthus lutarioriparius TaxID=422564 RepID=A0A811RA57_9POAL|nr:unnamed protein product [Miscanthus lutarioriparius]